MTFTSSSVMTSRGRAIRLCAITLTAAGLISGIAACSGTDSNSTSPPASAAPAAPSAPRKAAHGGMTGQISAINGSTWTVHSAQGKDITVDVTPQTQFGTKKAPATADQFTVGETVRIAGQRNNGTITATRVTQAKAAPASSASPAPSNG